MKNNIQAVIFDMDGLMIDSESIHSRAFEILVQRRGKQPVLNELGIIHKVGLRGFEICEDLRKNYELKEDIFTLRTESLEIFKELIKTTEIKIMPGLKKLINLLLKKQIKMAIASSSPKKSISIVLDNTKLSEFFDKVISGDDVLNPKPHPEAFLKAAKLLFTTPENCMVLEDSEIGSLAAKNAGMKVIAVPNKYTKHHDFSKSDKIVNSLSEITIPMLNNL